MDIVVLIIIGIVSRLVPHLPNATVVGSLALFGGSRLGVRKTLIVIFSTMLVTDLILGLHPVMWATYGSIVLYIFAGRLIKENTGAGEIAAATLCGSVLFFLVTNFAVWLIPGPMYPKTPAGLFECYVMAIPFLRNTILGDLFYSGVFFGGYALVRAMRTQIRKNRGAPVLPPEKMS